jgi:signal transduction histidine kinase
MFAYGADGAKSRCILPQKDEPQFPAQNEAIAPSRDYILSVNRPINIALGWRLPPWLLDYGPVAFILVQGVGAIVWKASSSGANVALLTAGLVVSIIALTLRHRAPLAALAAVMIAALVGGYGPVVTLPVLLAMFTVAEYRSRSTVIGAAVVAALVVIAILPLHGGVLTLPAVLSRLVAVGLSVAVGLYIRTRADYVTGLHERAERLEREQELLAHQAVADERVRIARELHDVVAHNVSLMVVQAQALAATGGGDPQQQETLGRVASLGREALTEMHRMLGVLRVQNGGAPEREPQPGVRDLEALVARTREAGLDARLVVDGDPRELPPGVDLSVYRIVQEALTNVIRHANAARSTVMLSYAPNAVEVTVTDDGVGIPPGALTAGASSGHGLVGMRERVALFGGELTARDRPDGSGFKVHASLPVE